jgi:hypothetical protein
MPSSVFGVRFVADMKLWMHQIAGIIIGEGPGLFLSGVATHSF